MKILVHICCAHCFAKTLVGLRREFGYSLEVAGYFYNPNIHPLIEFHRRLKAVKIHAERDPVPVEYVEDYGLELFCATIHPDYAIPARCAKCYELRLEKTAEAAVVGGFDAFTSTLVTSRHQSHELIRAAGEAAASRHGTEFLYRDLREAESDEAVVKGLYRQQYCGCVFSERDRFINTGKHLYKGGGISSSGD